MLHGLRIRICRCEPYDSVNAFIRFLFVEQIEIDGQPWTVVAGFDEGVEAVEVASDRRLGEAMETADNGLFLFVLNESFVPPPSGND